MAFGLAFDIGAYSCKAAILRGEKVAPEHLLYGENVLRSVVFVDQKNNILVGEKAIARAASVPKRAFYDIKRKILSGGKELPGIPQLTYLDLYVALIKECIKRCEKTLKKTGDSIDHVVLTVPSYLEERDEIIGEIKRAAEAIELSPGKHLSVDLLMEPAGVAIHNLNARAPSRKHTQIVYDLGHCTLDVALVSTEGDGEYAYTLHDYKPDNEVAGDYFDACLTDEIKRQFVVKGITITDRIERKIADAAAEIKHELSTHDTYTTDIYCNDTDDVAHSITITREQFERMIIGRLRDSASLVSNAIEVAKEKGLKVDEILLAGGGASIPLVERCVREVAGNIPVKQSLVPVDAVSFGASRYALKHNLLQKAKYAYGLQIPVKPGTISRYVHFMIPADATLPYRSKVFSDDLVCGPEGAFYTVLYKYKKAAVGQRLRAEDCEQIRHMMFCIAPNQPVSLVLEADEEHCVKVTCIANGKRYFMTSFDPAGAEPRKE